MFKYTFIFTLISLFCYLNANSYVLALNDTDALKLIINRNYDSSSFLPESDNKDLITGGGNMLEIWDSSNYRIKKRIETSKYDHFAISKDYAVLGGIVNGKRKDLEFINLNLGKSAFNLKRAGGIYYPFSFNNEKIAAYVKFLKVKHIFMPFKHLEEKDYASLYAEFEEEDKELSK